MHNINNQNNIKVKNVTFGSQPKETNSLEDNLTCLKKNMLQRCEYEIAEYGDFAPIKESISNKDEKIYAGNIGFLCEASESNPTKRYLSFHQYNPQNKKGLSCLIAAGTKEEIINKLNDEDFVKGVIADSQRISDKMKKLRW